MQPKVLRPQAHPKPMWRLPSHSGETRLPQGSGSSPSGPNLTPDRAVTVTEHRSSPGSHLALAPVPPTSAIPATKAVADSKPQKMQPLLTSDQLSHQSQTADCIGTLPQKHTLSRPGLITIPCNFIETEKVKQKHKREDYVSNKKPGKKP